MTIHTGFRGCLLRGVAPVACLLLASLPLVAPAAAENASKHDYQVLHSFNGSDGILPEDTVANDGSGNLVGTTNAGGTNGVGTVYRIAPDGTFTTIYNFGTGSDARYPECDPRLTVDKSGNIYGTSNGGGAPGGGAVFEISSQGTETVPYAFAGGVNGSFPTAAVTTEKKTGDIYGTTPYGGQAGVGNLFKLEADGTLTNIYSFGSGSDGEYPFYGMLEDKHHDFYGTTFLGGTSDQGMAFKIAADGTETILHNFTGGSDGGYPQSALIADASGNLYGTTGGNWGANYPGTIFKIAPDGTFTTLYAFTGGQDGDSPHTLAMDKKGNLYGTTYHGGAYGNGTVFELTSSGTEIVLHSFGSVPKDGAEPYEGVTLVDNWLYGTTGFGGKSNDGIVFKQKI